LIRPRYAKRQSGPA